jgi:hypothetical protein
MAIRIGASLACAVMFAGCSTSDADKATSTGDTRISPRQSFPECVAGWNAVSNREKQALVASVFVPAGYTSAGVQMSLTSGSPGRPDPNPIGCRVVFYKDDRWIAYLARRDGDQFRFRATPPKGRRSDQSGVWAKTARRGPTNARIVDGGKLELRG